MGRRGTADHPLIPVTGEEFWKINIMTDNLTDNIAEYEVGDYQPSHRGQFGTALAFLLIGASAGAIAALLLAPKNGRQVRRVLRRKYEDVLDTLGEWRDQAGERYEDFSKDLGNQAENLAGEAVSRSVAFGLAAQQRMGEAGEAVKERITSIRR